jgi:uncharacterized protein with NAD-binding domain and iron-sulfur cluster
VTVAVVGGGLAGITAALALQEAGVPVELFEARPRLGGATHSFPRDGLWVDNGQHVFLRCCTAYQGLLDRLGVSGRVRLQDRFEVNVLTPDGRSGRLRRAALPGPLHMLPTLGRYALLAPADRLRVGRAALALRALDPDDPALDQVSVGDWLAAHGQREQARDALWELFITAALNTGAAGAARGAAAPRHGDPDRAARPLGRRRHRRPRRTPRRSPRHRGTGRTGQGAPQGQGHRGRPGSADRGRR